MIAKNTALQLFQARSNHNDGAWVNHSQNTALAAEMIAKEAGLDSEAAYAYGLLHDIGRSFTKGQFLHITEGYQYLSDRGYEDAAQICLTHSFPIQNIYSYVGEIDIDERDQKYYQRKLQEIKYSDYDLLIQLCDTIATDCGFVFPEKRFVNLVFKYGFNYYTVDRWKRVLEIQDYFEKRTGKKTGEVLDAVKIPVL